MTGNLINVIKENNFYLLFNYKLSRKMEEKIKQFSQIKIIKTKTETK